MKKKRNFFRGEAAGGDLADTNEQELAKAPFSPFGKEEEPRGGKKASNDTEISPEGVAWRKREELPSEIGEERISESRGALDEPMDGAVPKLCCGRKETADGEEKEPKVPSDTGEEKGTRSRSGRGYPYILLIALCFVFALALVGGAVALSRPRDGADDAADTYLPPKNDTSDVSQGGQTVRDYSALSRTSVGIRASLEGEQIYFSGIGVFSDGYIATVYDPLLERGLIEVTVWNGKVYPAVFVGALPEARLSLLRISADSELEYLKESEISPKGVSEGDVLYGIGSAAKGELPCSLYVCNVSHSSRAVDTDGADGKRHILSAIQISGLEDNSLLGSPLFDGEGNGIAMAFSIDSGADVCFALSLHSAAELLRFVRDSETPSKEALSVLLHTPATLGIEGKQACIDGIWGIEIGGFSQNPDAERKLRRGDLIFRVDDTAVVSPASLGQLLEKYSSGETAEIFVYRHGQRLSFAVTLG